MKRILSLLLTLAMLFLLAVGCADTSEPAQSGDADVSVEEVAEPITVVDQGGNTVTLDKPAQRIVTCFYAQSYAMVALGLSDRVAAMEVKAESRPIYALAAPEMLELPNVGSQKEFNVEAAIAAEPDLVLLPKKLQDTAETFAAVGIPVAICYPETQELLEEQLVMIATLCGVPERAEALLTYYHEKFASVEEKVSAIDDADKPSVCMCGVSDYLSVAPAEMYQSGLIEAAGGINAAADIEDTYWAEVSYEQLLAMNPDVIILPSEAKYSAEDICADAQLSELTAVKNGAVYAMPSAFEAWDSPVPSGVLGTLWLLAVLHGDVYTMDDMRADAVEFYQTFYGFEADVAAIN